MDYSDGSGSYTATGTLIADQWVLAAQVGPSQGWDLALFRLETAVTGITPAQIYTGTRELGQTVDTVGLGRGRWMRQRWIRRSRRRLPTWWTV